MVMYSPREAPLTNVDVAAVNASLTIVLPTLNEEAAVGKVIDELRQVGYERILLVDGHSTDRTVELAKECGVDVVYQQGDGKTNAIQTAINRVETPYFLVMDCDYTYDPKDIAQLLERRDDHDLVIGVRSNGKTHMARLNRLGNWVLNHTFKYLIGSDLSDVCSGMYLLKTATARQLDFTTRGFSVEVDIASQVSMSRSVGEVPITFRKRLGSQKLARWSDGFTILAAIVALARRHNPLFLFLPLALMAGIPAIFILVWVAYTALVHGVWHSGYALFGGILVIGAFQAFILAMTSLLLKRMEKRLERRLSPEYPI